MQVPYLQRASPASIVAKVLTEELGGKDGLGLGRYIFVDYCAGGGGPIPYVERFVNEKFLLSQKEDDGTPEPAAAAPADAGVTTRSKAAKTPPTTKPANGQHIKPVHFVLTDLHPHIPNWSAAASRSSQIHYSPQPVDASNSPANLLTTLEPPLPSPLLPSSSSSSQKSPATFRTFHLAFHHFPDPLARAILRNTMQTSAGFAILELQDRSLSAFLAICLFGLAILLFAPYYAWKWRSPATLFWCWVVPVVPFVLVFDGCMSALRTRTVDEVRALMGDEEEGWDVRSGKEVHLPPCAELLWIVATKKGQ